VRDWSLQAIERKVVLSSDVFRYDLDSHRCRAESQIQAAQTEESRSVAESLRAGRLPLSQPASDRVTTEIMLDWLVPVCTHQS
jgi:hypothetical protein